MDFLILLAVAMALVSLAALPVFGAEDIEMPSRDVEFAPGELETDWSEQLSPSAVVLPESKSEIDLIAGLSYVYDSNRSRRPGGSGGSLALFDFGFRFASGRESSRGGFYGLNYNGRVYSYEDTFSTAGTDFFDHNVSGVVGLNGAKTRIRLTTRYSHDGGNLIDFDQSDREARNAESDDYSADLDVVRDLPHGSLEFGTGFARRNFEDDVNFSDSSRPYFDAAWFYKPGFASKTELGLGLRTGTDDSSGNLEQDYTTPSFRWRYRLSGKTSLNGSVGYEFRSTEGPMGFDSENPVYRTGLTWAATGKTSFDFSAYQEVRPSSVLGGQSYEATGVSARMNYRLPQQFEFGATVGVEQADYFSSRSGVVATRDDDFFRLGLTLGRPIRLMDNIATTAGLFYNYYETESNQPGASFEQHVTGVRIGITY